MDPLLGRTLDARYRLDRRVGAGGFGTVYAATVLGGAPGEPAATVLGGAPGEPAATVLGGAPGEPAAAVLRGAPGEPAATVLSGAPGAGERVVAVKVLRPPEGVANERSEERARRFRDEAELLLRLRHPAIVPALGSGTLELDGERVPYLVLEWCEGGTLEEELARRAGHGMPLAEALAVLTPVLDALAHAHDLGVVHRDVKPSNVMLTRTSDGRTAPRVIDFGIAKIVDPDAAGGASAGSGDTRTASSSLAFTPAYAAPEQVAGARTGPWTDVHALGLLFVELVRGRPPYAGDPLRAIDPVRPTPALFGIDVGPLEPVLARALALRPDERYPDARALEAAVRAAWHTEGHASTVLAASSPPARPALAAHAATPSQPAGAASASSPVDLATAPTELVQVSATRARPRGWLVPTLVAALLGVSALAVAGLVGGRARSTTPTEAPVDAVRREERPVTPAPSGSVSAAPRPALFDPCSAARSELEARAAPAKVLSASSDDYSRTMFFSNDAGDDPGGHYLQVLRLAHLEAVPAHERARTIDRLVAGQVPGSNAIVYGVEGLCVTMLRGPQSAATLRVFERLMAGARFDVRGDTLGGPDPINERVRAFRVPHVAKRLRELSVDELESRLRTLGDVTSFEPNSIGASAQLRRDAWAGTFVLYRAAATASLRALEKTAPIAFHSASDGEVGVAVYGVGPFAEAAYLRKALEGIPLHPVAAPRPRR